MRELDGLLSASHFTHFFFVFICYFRFCCCGSCCLFFCCCCCYYCCTYYFVYMLLSCNWDSMCGTATPLRRATASGSTVRGQPIRPHFCHYSTRSCTRKARVFVGVNIRGIPSDRILAWSQVSVPLIARPVARYRRGGTTPMWSLASTCIIMSALFIVVIVCLLLFVVLFVYISSL